MSVVAEVVDAVIGGDTHRDTHALEMTAPTGATIATLVIGNDQAGFAEALSWIVEHAPGPQIVVGLEGTRSYGIALARALQAAGLVRGAKPRQQRSATASGQGSPSERSSTTSPTSERYFSA